MALYGQCPAAVTVIPVCTNKLRGYSFHTFTGSLGITGLTTLFPGTRSADTDGLCKSSLQPAAQSSNPIQIPVLKNESGMVRMH